jgi:ketosteroid isomerase-like protein
MKYFLSISLVIFCWTACTNETKKESYDDHNDKNEKVALLETDKAFSKMSEEKGMKAAFIEYIDSNGVLLRPNRLPIIGANAIDFLIQQNDSAYTLTWQPHNGDVARSGEMGYTYGIWTLKPRQQDTTLYGTYVSIWKKQHDGHWKFVLDTGNDGIGQ